MSNSKETVESIIEIKTSRIEIANKLNNKLQEICFKDLPEDIIDYTGTVEIPYCALETLLSESARLSARVKRLEAKIEFLNIERSSGIESDKKNLFNNNEKSNAKSKDSSKISLLEASKIGIREVRRDKKVKGSKANAGDDIDKMKDKDIRNFYYQEVKQQEKQSKKNKKEDKKKKNLNSSSEDGNAEVRKRKEKLLRLEAAMSKLSNADIINFATLFRNMLHSVHLNGSPHIQPWIVDDSKSNNSSIMKISAPEDSSISQQTLGPFASGQVTSTYPHILTRPYRDGDPICDRYTLTLYENRAIVCLTDGCNWGEKPRKASRVANKAFINYLENFHRDINKVSDCIPVLIGGITDAHLSILHNKDPFAAGTTTICGGILLQIDQKKTKKVIRNEIASVTPLKPYCFVSVCLGDCKIIHYSLRNNQVNDITIDNTFAGPRDATDPGGRLGPPIDGSDPDLRNLSINYAPCEPGDIIVAMSDGIHDNIDPEFRGLNPSDIIGGDPNMTWDQLNPDKCKTIKQNFLEEFILNQIIYKNPNDNNNNNNNNSNNNNNDDDIFIPTPRTIVHNFIENAVELTRKNREFMSLNPKSKVPKDFKKNPGKFDHTSCVAFRVGAYCNWSRPGLGVNIDPLDEEIKRIYLSKQKTNPTYNKPSSTSPLINNTQKKNPPTVPLRNFSKNKTKSQLNKTKNWKRGSVASINYKELNF